MLAEGLRGQMNGTLTLRNGTRLVGRVVSRTKVGDRWNCRMVFPAEAGSVDWRSAMTLRIGSNIEQCTVTAERLGQNLCVVRVASRDSNNPPWR